MIYLDSAATTSVLPDVLDEAMPFLTDHYANPGAMYTIGREAEEAVDLARARAASLFGCEPCQIIFTSGGSESNSMVFRSVSDHLKEVGKKHIMVSESEHDSVIGAAVSLTSEGFDVEYIPVGDTGTVSVQEIIKRIRPDTGLVSVMYVNNETGAVNPVEDIGAICMKHDILFHTDCVQAAGTHKVDVSAIGCSFASISGHKIRGFKGTGALFVREPLLEIMRPLIYGGAFQEMGLRGGTENVPGIVALGKACELSSRGFKEELVKSSTMKQEFYIALTEALSDVGLDGIMHVNGPSVITPGKILNVRFDGVDGETLLMMLNTRGVCASAGSACHSHDTKPSRVLMAMGLTDEQTKNSLRFSFSSSNTEDEIREAAAITADCIGTLLDHCYQGR